MLSITSSVLQYFFFPSFIVDATSTVIVRRDAIIVFGTIGNLDVKCSGAQVDECSLEKMLFIYAQCLLQAQRIS